MQRKSQNEINKEIEALIEEKDRLGRGYRYEDKLFIDRYRGSGGAGASGAKGRGLLFEYYTPDYLVSLMWQLAEHHGFQGGNVLEPSCGTGRFFKPAGPDVNFTGFETNKTSARIAQILFPKAEVHNLYFEQAFMEAPWYRARLKKELTWLKGSPFDMVIGNPPFGTFKSRYSSQFRHPKVMQIEIFFMYYGLRLLKKGGLLVYLIPPGFMRTGSKYEKIKNEMGLICELLDAYHLPPIFNKTGIATDIIVLKRK